MILLYRLRCPSSTAYIQYAWNCGFTGMLSYIRVYCIHTAANRKENEPCGWKRREQMNNKKVLYFGKARWIMMSDISFLGDFGSERWERAFFPNRIPSYWPNCEIRVFLFSYLFIISIRPDIIIILYHLSRETRKSYRS